PLAPIQDIDSCGHPPAFLESTKPVSKGGWYFFLTSFLFQKVSKQNRTRKYNTCLRIPSPGPLRGPRPAAPPLWTVPVHVPGHGAWEPAHHPGHQL
uniref:Uncharacterized protein n=1 Tax=Marmota marmota marmota TaxID=9994 RepID=A0A8C6EYQ3_MARMA